VGRTIVRANRTSPRLFGVRAKKVRYVAVTSRRTIAKRSSLRALMRYAGLPR
jgi:hypothetical protein